MKQKIISYEELLKLNPLLREQSEYFCQDILKVLTDCGYELSENGENFFNPQILKVIAVSRLHELEAQKIKAGTNSIKRYLFDHGMRVRLGETFKFVSFLFGRLAIYSTVLLLIFGLFFFSFKNIALFVGILIGCKIVFSIMSYILRKEIEKLRSSF